jgi:TPR repeat protein
MGSKALEMYLWIARSFENGDGVSKDPAEAMAWYRIAADEGSSQARSHLEGEKRSALTEVSLSSVG